MQFYRAETTHSADFSRFCAILRRTGGRADRFKDDGKTITPTATFSLGQNNERRRDPIGAGQCLLLLGIMIDERNGQRQNKMASI